MEIKKRKEKSGVLTGKIVFKCICLPIITNMLCVQCGLPIVQLSVKNVLDKAVSSSEPQPKRRNTGVQQMTAQEMLDIYNTGKTPGGNTVEYKKEWTSLEGVQRLTELYHLNEDKVLESIPFMNSNWRGGDNLKILAFTPTKGLHLKTGQDVTAGTVMGVFEMTHVVRK
jgi:hypothetical protein